MPTSPTPINDGYIWTLTSAFGPALTMGYREDDLGRQLWRSQRVAAMHLALENKERRLEGRPPSVMTVSLIPEAVEALVVWC